ncbi:MAG: TrkH family potassium uptake protein [Saccharofermentans sp.]|nr:TrkH family potassium uptake protein [Saccharofermentans sp.]
MNYRMHIFVTGKVMVILGALMAIPIVAGIWYREMDNVLVYIITAVSSIAIGFLLSLKKPSNTKIFLKDSCVITAVSWIVMSLVGCIPFMLTGEIPDFTNAVFETVSGFTTTGASILTNVEGMSHISLMWRSLTHWIGGMGVIVFLLAVVPMAGGTNLNLMKAESPGPSVGKLVPKVRSTAKALYLIYLALTVLEIVVLLCCRMPLFDSICSAFGTAGTGGFGIKNDSFASYSPAIQWVVTVFMVLFGVNFNFYYLIISKQIAKSFKMEEVKIYLLIIVSAIGVIAINIHKMYDGVMETIRHASFQVATVITTTGYATEDFDNWPSLSKCILVILMFVGACAGSTGGGMKVVRLIIRVKSFAREVAGYIHPNSIKTIHLDGKPADNDMVRSVSTFYFAYLMIFTASLILVSIESHDLVTNFTAVAATINNIGPGLALVGPTSNYSFFGILSKWTLIFDMLAGRLELFPLIIFLYPGTYKSSLRSRFSKRIR